MGGHAHFAWYELLTTYMGGGAEFCESVLGWTVHDATSKFGCSIFNAGDSPVCGFMELPLWAAGAGELARRLQGFILQPL